MSIELTIAIPTYNRLPLLRQTIESLLPQLCPEVEILVCNNCSTDGTTDYLDELLPAISHFKQPRNIGAEGNFLSCIKIGSGRYIWLLGDDDIPCSNALDLILGAISTYKDPGFISLRPLWCDKHLSQRHNKKVSAEWEKTDKNELIFSLGEMITFASIIVMQRKLIDTEGFLANIGTSLAPAALALQVISASSNIIRSKEEIIFARGANAGGYNAYRVFTRNLSELIVYAEKYGYNKKALASIYRSALRGCLQNIVSVWRPTLPEMLMLIRYSFGYKEFYLNFLPSILKRFVKMTIPPWFMTRKTTTSQILH